MEKLRHPGGVPISLSYPEIPLHAFLENTARKYPHRTAAIFYGSRISYGRLWDESLRLAGALNRLGLEKGGRVAMLLPNVPPFIVAYNVALEKKIRIDRIVFSNAKVRVAGIRLAGSASVPRSHRSRSSSRGSPASARR